MVQFGTIAIWLERWACSMESTGLSFASQLLYKDIEQVLHSQMVSAIDEALLYGLVHF